MSNQEKTIIDAMAFLITLENFRLEAAEQWQMLKIGCETMMQLISVSEMSELDKAKALQAVVVKRKRAMEMLAKEAGTPKTKKGEPN